MYYYIIVLCFDSLRLQTNRFWINTFHFVQALTLYALQSNCC